MWVCALSTTQPPKTPLKQNQAHEAFDELAEVVGEAALDGEGEDGFDDFFEPEEDGKEG